MNGTPTTAIATVAEPVLTVINPLDALSSATAMLRQRVKETAADMSGPAERDLLSVMQSLDSAVAFLGFAARKLARGE